MTSSDQINELAVALAKAQGAMANAVKDSANPFFRSKYADLASVWDACRKALTDQALSVVQVPDVKFEGAPEFESYTTRSGDERWRAKVITRVTVLTRLLHGSGQWIDDEIAAILPAGDPQSIGSAITYLRRYALSAMVGVAPEDDDAEAASKPSERGGYTMEAPKSFPERQAVSAIPAAPAGPSLVNGQLYIRRVESKPTKKPGIIRYDIMLSTGESVATIKGNLAALAESACQDNRPVTIKTKESQYGTDLVDLKFADKVQPAHDSDDEIPALTDADIAF